MICKLRLLGIAVLLLAACAGGFAQTVSGDLTGTIYDQSGATVPDANVIARNQSTGIEVSTKSTNTGDYRIANLPAGAYTLSVNAPGFTRKEIKNVAVELNKISTSNVTLDVGTAVETVEVTTAAVAIDTTTAQLQTAFQTAQLMDLPTASQGSGILNLSLLSAGVSTSGAVGAGTGPSVGGQRPRNNNFTIEGIDNNSDSVTGPVVSLPNDAVAEFTVLQNQFAADFGHSSGGQFNTVVKSGTNELHGSAYEYLQNRNLNAADNYNAVNGLPLHSRFDDNRFGGTVGGPIQKNKLFFFVNYEYEPTGYTGSAGTLFAPTAAGWSTLAGIPGINQTNLAVLQKYLGSAPTAAPPATTPNGSYPLINSTNQGYYGQATTGISIPIGQLPVTAPSFTNNERAVASIDDTLSEKDNLRFRFILNRNGAIDTAAQLPAFYQTVPTNGYIATFSEYHTFTPTLTNEFRLGYNRYSNVTPAGNYSFPGLDSFPNLVIFDLGAQLGPDPNAPQFGYQNTYEITNNVIWTKGNHSFKFGFDGNKLISPQSFTQRARGDYEYSYLSDYLFDYVPDQLGERTVGNVTYYGDRTTLALYANDNWKIKPNFTINLGVRYEYQTLPYTETLQGINAVADTPGLITFSAPKAQPHDFMPRIGLAYSPGTSGHTSIRAGFGINYDVLYDNLGLLSLPPQDTTTVDVGGNLGSNFLRNGGIPPSASAGTLDRADAIADTSGYVPDQKRPKALQWNIGIQHVFWNNYTFETRYVGTRGYDLTVQDRLNVQAVVNASNSLPMYFTAPSQATLNSLTHTQAGLEAAYNAGGYFLPQWAAAGFNQSFVVGFMPIGNSTYHGWANQLTRRFSNGLQFTAAYTFSHDIDDSTADVFSTETTPRRPEDFQDLRIDRGNSALDHKNRLTGQVLYDFNPFKHGNWLLKNVVGNWEAAPIYTYQTGTWVTIQSGVDSNLNGDAWPDRTIVNPSGNPDIGSTATPLTNSQGQVVAFLATNPNARYVVAPKGVLPNAARNTAQLRPIDDVDMTFAKNFNLGHEGGPKKLQLQGRFFNMFNHPQYTGGYLNDVASIGYTSTAVRNFLIPGNSTFMQPSQVFSSNPRSITISAKFIF
jgi:hypothetical protein